MLVLADFGGSHSNDLSSQLAQRKIQRVDIDNFGKLLTQTRPIVQVPLSHRSDLNLEIEIKDLDDFHPDNLYNTLPVFNELRELRLQLSNPKTFSQAAKKLQAALPQPQMETGQTPTAQSEPTHAAESNAAALQRLLRQSASITELPARSSSHSGIDRFINEIVAPFVLPGKDPRQEEFLKNLDTAVASQLRNILHHGTFQSLEASWRGLHFLVSNVAMTEELQVFMLHVTKAELLQAIETDGGRLEDSLLFRRLVTEREEMPWSLLVGDFSFGKQTEELILLGCLGMIAARSGGPFIASASPGLLGYNAWSDELQTTVVVNEMGTETDHWQALRSSPVAQWIGRASLPAAITVWHCHGTHRRISVRGD
jgi:type VI secretion system ImpB/VipA family protein